MLKPENNELIKLRSMIDEVDNKLVDLYIKRLELIMEVGKYKKKNNMGIMDNKREEEKFYSVLSCVDEIKKGDVDMEFFEEAVKDLFEFIMKKSKEYQV